MNDDNRLCNILLSSMKYKEMQFFSGRALLMLDYNGCRYS